MNPLLWYVFTIVTTGIISYRAAVSKKLTKYGSITAFLMGCITLGLQPVIGGQVLALFFLGKIVTKIGASKKLKIEDGFTQQRDSYQVLANGGISLFLTILYSLNLIDSYAATICSLFAISASTGDTFSSEIGILSSESPRMITSFKKVPRGTNGGVTSFGLLAAALGGLFIGLITCLIQFKFQIDIVLLATLSGLTGSTIDSLLGALLEFSGVDSSTGKVVGKIGFNVKIIQARSILSGNSVNFLSSLLTMLIFKIVFV